MLKPGHYGAALLVYAPIGYLLLSVDPALTVLGALGVVLLARLPDWDLRVPGLDHRGVTHTLVFLFGTAAVLGVLGYVFAGAFGIPARRTAGLGVVIAIVAVGSHLFADWLTPSGVPLLWPLTERRFSANVARTTSPVANYGLLALGIGITLAVSYLAGRV